MTFDWILQNIGRVMPLTCPLLLLFVLKLEKYMSQELEILYRAWAQKISENLFFCVFFFSVGISLLPLSLSPTPSPPKEKKKKTKILFLQIWILSQNSLTRELKFRVVGFVL